MNTADLDPKRVVVCLEYKKSQSKSNGCLNPCIYSENNVFTIEIERVVVDLHPTIRKSQV